MTLSWHAHETSAVATTHDCVNSDLDFSIFRLGGELTMLIISVRSLASRTLTSVGGCSVVCNLDDTPDFPGPP